MLTTTHTPNPRPRLPVAMCASASERCAFIHPIRTRSRSAFRIRSSAEPAACAASPQIRARDGAERYPRVLDRWAPRQHFRLRCVRFAPALLLTSQYYFWNGPLDALLSSDTTRTGTPLSPTRPHHALPMARAPSSRPRAAARIARPCGTMGKPARPLTCAAVTASPAAAYARSNACSSTRANVRPTPNCHAVVRARTRPQRAWLTVRRRRRRSGGAMVS